MASEMLFALDTHEDKDNYTCLDGRFQVEVKPTNNIDEQLEQRTFPFLSIEREESSLQQLVSKLYLKMLMSSEDPGRPLSGGHTHPRSTALKELVLLLRLHGLDARLLMPVPLGGGPGCGRWSTGEGGQCAAASGKRCFFCSRQPYAVVRDPSPSSLSNWEMHPPVDTALEVKDLIIFEPHLRDLFCVAPSTAEYAAAVEQLPQVWVGPLPELIKLANKMCGAMAINFRSQGLDIPPWRRRAAVMTRWDLCHLQREMVLEPSVGLGGACTCGSEPAALTPAHRVCGRVAACKLLPPSPFVAELDELRSILQRGRVGRTGAPSPFLPSIHQLPHAVTAPTITINAGTKTAANTDICCSTTISFGPTGATDQAEDLKRPLEGLIVTVEPYHHQGPFMLRGATESLRMVPEPQDLPFPSPQAPPPARECSGTMQRQSLGHGAANQEHVEPESLCGQEAGRTGKPRAPAVVVYGFNLPTPARAV